MEDSDKIFVSSLEEAVPYLKQGYAITEAAGFPNGGWTITLEKMPEANP